jgi:phosphoesterase RecJ-like protein
MHTNLKTEILKNIEKYDSIIIHRHINPDMDAIGSQLALKHILKDFFNSEVYVVGETVKGLNYLGEMDVVSDELFERSLCFVLDTANEERISDQRYKNAPCVIKIDHHPERESFGDLSWVDPSFSSTSEMLVDFFMFGKDLNIPDSAAELLYTGIVGDTGGFQYSNANSRTLYYASLLLRHNFNAQDVFANMNKISAEESVAKGVLLSKFKVTNNGVGWFYFDQKLMDDLGIEQSQVANLVNTMANIDGIHIWVLFVEGGDSCRVEIRSSKIAINEIAIKYNGGGHPLASGTSLHSFDEMIELVNDLDQLLVK